MGERLGLGGPDLLLAKLSWPEVAAIRDWELCGFIDAVVGRGG